MSNINPKFCAIPIGTKFSLSKHNQNQYRKVSTKTALNLTYNRVFYFRAQECVYLRTEEWDKVSVL